MGDTIDSNGSNVDGQRMIFCRLTCTKSKKRPRTGAKVRRAQ
jgi:hypothetical protein